MVKVQNLTKTYSDSKGGVQAVKNVTFEVHPNEFVMIQGPSGSGKSTLLFALAGLLQPEEGTVCVEQQNIYELSLESRARFRLNYFGFVFQQFYLVPYLNVIENILLPSITLESALARARADELIQRFNLSERRNHTPQQLSSGEQQRTALARALLNRPKIILADEPTGNLDEENANIVLKTLADFARKEGSVILVTHDERALPYAQRCFKMEQGTLTEKPSFS
jgi:putative ABC transport system ATP-binding protein